MVGLVLCCGTVEAEEVENEACLACHGAEDLVGPEGRSLFVGADAFAASVHAPLSCVTYHVDAAGKRVRMRDGQIMEGVDGTRYLMKNDAVWRSITEKGTLHPSHN